MAPYLQDDSFSSSSEISTPPLLATVNNVREPEPIAIVGMGCRLPGGIKTPQDLWKLLVEKQSGQCDVPPSRWNIDGFYHPNGQRPGSMNTRGGYFIKDDIRQFDNGFFGINNLEATYMDPQQRKLLEVCYECFESAGATLEDIDGANIGCYVGNFTIDFITMQAKDAEYFHRYHATGMGTTILSNRISHVFNLTGPSVVLDTACSSSLYAVHMACAAIDAGECDAAIAAGANLVQSPEQHLGTMKAGVLSATSTCHTFDASADGYGRADGVGAIYLKKLSKALEDNDPIRGIIRGSAVNANGKTNGITLPSSDGQEAVIRKAYAKAGLEHRLDETNYVECHGTGTAVGDPIELEAVSRVFEKRPSQHPLYVGSVKTNLGHSEAASGFSSVFKVVMALEKGIIPATIGVKSVNPKIKADDWRVKIVTEAMKWPTGKPNLFVRRPAQRAGVNSFGYGGANSHVILEAADSFVPSQVGLSSEILSEMKSAFILPVSANSLGSLQAQISNLLSVELQEVNVVDLAYTLGTRRSALPSRAYAIVGQKTLANLNPMGFITADTAALYKKLPFAFVFTGQGAQWAQMGKELLDEIPSFRKSLVELDNALQKLPHAPSWSLRQALLDPKDTSQINHVTRSQPVCTAVQIAFVDLLRKWGIEPEAVIGHSSGEIAAAYAAGFLTAAEAIIVAYYRGYVVGHCETPLEGGMIAAGLGKYEAEREINALGLSNAVRVACINSPENVTISGDAGGVGTILAHLQTKGIFSRKLNTNGRAYHSHHMGLLGQEYEDLLQQNLPLGRHYHQQHHKVRWVSSVTGQTVTGKVQGSYWRSNLESPVQFSDAIEGLVRGAKYHLIELGPHSALELPIKQTLSGLRIKDGEYHYSSALIRNKNGVTCLLKLVGDLFLHGHTIDFAQVNYVEQPTTALALHDSKYPTHQQGKVITNLPPYAWTYDTLLWSECRASIEFRERIHPHHDLLGSQKPGGDGLRTVWRNMLKAENVPWVLDHRLNDTVVFPGAGYIAMSIEAICQVSGQHVSDPVSIGLRQFRILKALVLPTDTNTSGVEIFTTIKRMLLSAATTSQTWWEFEVTSYNDGLSTTHAVGKIRITRENNLVKPNIMPTNVDLEALAIRNWYGQFTKVGLNYGPDFAALEEIRTPREKNGRYAIAKTQLQQGGGEGKESQSRYLIHPITIDVMLQAGIIASTSGIIKDLRANVPVSIEEAFFQAPHRTSQGTYQIDATANRIGFAAYTLNACLYDCDKRPSVVLKDVRVTGYQGATQAAEDEMREPMLRVLWKPDVTTLSSDKLAQYLSSCADSEPQQIAAIVDILAHKNPRLRILDLFKSDELTASVVETLRGETSFKRYKSYCKGYLTDDGQLFFETVDPKQPNGEVRLAKLNDKEKFDLLIAGDTLSDDKYAHLTEFLAPNGTVLKTSSTPTNVFSDSTAIRAITPTGGNVELLTPHDIPGGEIPYDGILIVEEVAQASFNDALAKHLSGIFSQPVRRVLFHELLESTITSKSFVISTIELNRPVLSTLTGDEMRWMKLITDNALNLLWLTGGDNLLGTRPEFALMSGLSRAIMLEQPSLRITMLDLDVIAPTSHSMGSIATVMRQSVASNISDYEYVQKNGLLHISRMLPEETMNRTFQEKQGEIPKLIPVQDAKPARLGIGIVGQFDTLAFQQEVPDQSPLEPGTVEIEVMSVGLNAKDFYALAGRVNTKDAVCKLESSGIVTRIAPHGIQRLAVGDRVVTIGPGHFTTHERVPEWACQKLLDDEDFDVVTTLPLVFSTAIYALHYRAQIQHGESVLIHSAAGGLGNAAIQIAQLADAEIYATVSTEEKKEYLVNTFNLRRDHIFNSRDSSFLHNILAITGGRGVDIVLNSLTGDLLHDSWRACAPWGRFVEVGKQDITDAGKLDMEVFQRNVTFTAFDLSELSDKSHPRLNRIASSLLAETMALYREKKIKAIEPLKVFDVSEITQAYRYFGLGNRMGKIAISLKDGGSLIPTLSRKYDSTFSPEKTYLMVGCLGGLGRSISKWMAKRGARRFVFIGRSGTDREPARLLVEDLKSSGAEVAVVRGDVGVYADVQAAVSAIEGPIGGIIQAAMGLNEALWTRMPVEYWHTGIDPKLIGSWNLYNALEGRTGDLEFFLMTSSVSGSVGTATEGNYCAANYFLDVFARFLRGKGVPGLSIGLGMISEVGYLHENPEIEALLLRKGIQAINEDELLQIIDISLSSSLQSISGSYDRMATCHVLTGLEPQGMKQLQKAGFSGNVPVLDDPRAGVLAAALDTHVDGDVNKTNGSDLPSQLADALAGGRGQGQSVLAAITDLIVRRFANLVLQQVDKIDATRSLSKFGMDSMLAAEFRTWFYHIFKVDVPFLTLLAESTTLTALGELVLQQIETE